MFITIDGGTTNTRISIADEEKIIETVKLHVGARNGIDDQNALKAAVRGNIAVLLKNNGLTENDIEKILASGMITSEYGLRPLEHIAAPAGIKELHDSMCEVHIDEISSIPFVFIRGVKICGDSLKKSDMMRGEETELMGIMSRSDGRCMYILPGSHSKLIETNSDGKIIHFTTMLTGEMTAALSQNTILKDAVDLSIPTDSDYLLKGYEYCSEHGINEALFKVRILKNIFKCTAEQIYSFFMGIILCGEVRSVIESDIEKIIIGGKKQIREAEGLLIKANSDKEVIILDDETVDSSTAKGMIKIYKYTE